MLWLSTPPLIICLGRLHITCRHIFNLCQLRQGVDSLAQWLEHWIFIWTDQVPIPRNAGIFLQLCFIPLLCPFMSYESEVIWSYVKKTTDIGQGPLPCLVATYIPDLICPALPKSLLPVSRLKNVKLPHQRESIHHNFWFSSKSKQTIFLLNSKTGVTKSRQCCGNPCPTCPAFPRFLEDM